MLNKNDTGLIVVDVQGKLATVMSDSEQVIDNIAKLIKGCQAIGLPIIWLEQNPEKLGDTHPTLKPLLAEADYFAKMHFSGFRNQRVQHRIAQLQCNDWLLCGIESHVCVYQTAKDLVENGYQSHVVMDAVSSRDPANKQLAQAKFSAENIAITGLEMCLLELLESCKAEQFKAILGLIK